MATLEEAEAKWKAETPQGDMTDAEYEALADAMAPALLEQMTQQEAQEANKQEGQAIKEQAQWLEDTAVNLRDTSKTMTSQQIRNVIAQGFDILAHVIRYLHKQRNPEEQGDA